MNEFNLPYGWTPRDYQWPLWDALEAGCKRAIAVWHRRAGKDLFAINRIAYEMYRRPGLYWHCFPTYAQGRKIAWEGFTKAGRKFQDAFPPPLIKSRNDKDMKIELAGPTAEQAGSIYQVVGTDEIDRLVGANPIGVVFSEYALSDPQAYQLIIPILRENNGWAMFIYTPRGHNHGWDLIQNARKEGNNKRWFSQVLTVEDTKHDGKRVVSQEMIDMDIADGMSPELVQQEYYCSFDAPLVGSYFATEMSEARKQGRIGKVPYEPILPVDTAWDLGMDDSMTIWFTQSFGTEIRIIDYYENSGEGFPHYAKILKGKPYLYGTHHMPHDIVVRELNEGKSREEQCKSLGIKPLRITKKVSFEDGIEAARNTIPLCWFDEEKCQRGIEALQSYQKVFNEERKIFGTSPLRNWATHGADAFKNFSVARKVYKGDKKKKLLQHSGLRDYIPGEH